MDLACFELITNPRLLDVAESLCGEELVASSVYRLRPKIPNYNYGAVPWHQDSAYFEPYCDKSLVLTVWIPLVDANAENGCLWVIPRVHTGKIAPHRPAEGKAYLEILEQDLPPGDRICCPVPKGGALLLTNRTPHGSYENTTDIVRWSLDLRYQSASLPTNAKISRLPGESTPQGARWTIRALCRSPAIRRRPISSSAAACVPRKSCGPPNSSPSCGRGTSQRRSAIAGADGGTAKPTIRAEGSVNKMAGHDERGERPLWL